MNLKQVGNVIGIFVGLAIVSVIAANPDFLKITFQGISGVITAAERPVLVKR